MVIFESTIFAIVAALVSLNVLAVTTGAADKYYESITEFLHPLLMTS